MYKMTRSSRRSTRNFDIENYEDINNKNKVIEDVKVKNKITESELAVNLKSNLNKVKLDNNHKEVGSQIQNDFRKEKKESRLKFLKDGESMKKAIVLKELLDKPLAMRK